jgi:hypothetical protein
VSVSTLNHKNGVHGTFTVAPWAVEALSQTGKGRRNNGYKDRDACGRGHLYSEGRFHIGKDGCRRCNICHAESAKRQKMTRTPEEAERRRERARISRRENAAARAAGISVADWRAQFGDTIAKKNPLVYLAMTGDKAYASDALNERVDTLGRPKCEVLPDAYTDVDESVSTADAKKMCAGCPLMGTGDCLAYGRLIVPDVGRWIFEGKLFVDGKIQK